MDRLSVQATTKTSFWATFSNTFQRVCEDVTMIIITETEKHEFDWTNPNLIRMSDKCLCDWKNVVLYANYINVNIFWESIDVLVVFLILNW